MNAPIVSARRASVIGASLVVALTTLGLMLTGASLGMLLAGIAAVILALPQVDDSTYAPKLRLLIASCTAGAVACIWLLATASDQFTFMQFILSTVVLFSITGAAAGLRTAGLPSPIVSVLLIAWFTVPVWASRLFLSASGETLAGFVTKYHPVFALNRVMLDSGAWTHRPMAYQFLTNLGQDVAYTLPDSIAPCVLLHITAGAVGWCVRLGGRRIARY